MRKQPDKKAICVRIPSDLHAKVVEKLRDPVRNKTKYGGMSDLINALLQQYLKHDPLDSL